MSIYRCSRIVLLVGLLLPSWKTPAENLTTGVYCDKTALYAEAKASHHLQYAPSKEIDITHQTLDVTPDFDQRSVVGTVKIEFSPIARPLPELRLDAVDLTVLKVDASAAILGWQNTGKELILTFKEPVPAGTASWVTIHWTVQNPDKGLYFRTPAMGYKEGDTHLWTQGEMEEARHWFPCYDYPNEKFTTEMICHVKKGMVALSNGRLVSKDMDPNTGLIAWHWLQDKPQVNYLITLCAGYYDKIEDNSGDVPLAFWTPHSQIGLAKNSFAGTKDMVAFFEVETGTPYPWPRYDQVVVDDFTFGGMENISQTTLTDRTLFPDEFAGTRSSESLIAHELAHQWFGDLVTTKDWANIWLNEGFATFYDALYQEHHHGRDAFLYDMLNNARNVLGQANDGLPIVYRGYDDPEEQFGYRAYPKGAWVLNMLRNQLGPELYRRCIKTHLARHAFDNVTTDDLKKVVEELSGRDWDQFFDEYVYHAHNPELKVGYSWDERTKMAKISIEQVQKLSDAVLLFKLPLKIRFKSGGTITDGIADVSQTSEDFFFALPDKPEIVRIDPDFTWLARVDFPLPAEMLYNQLDDPSDMVGRIFAIEQIEKRKDKASVDKLQYALNLDPFWGVRREAAQALQRMHTDDARAALLASTNQLDGRVRRAVVEAIGSFFRSDTPVVLAEIVAHESNPDIQNEALRALAAYPVDTVKDTLIARLHSSSFKDVVAGAAIDAIRAQASPVYLDPLLKMLREREAGLPSPVLANGLNTLAVLGHDEKNKAPVREFLVGHLNDPKHSVQLATIRALGTLDDPEAIALLQTFAGAGKETPQRPVAEAAIKAIRASQPQAAEVNTLRDEVLKLQQQNRDLKQDFDNLRKQLDAHRSNAESGGKKAKKSGWFSHKP